MMSDSRIAKALLSAIIGERIVELFFTATERVVRKDANINNIDKTLEQLTVCRFDFRAKIETDDGCYKTVSIELQKAKLDTDIMRFRRYLGEMYQDVDNSYDEERLRPREIYCVYILNYAIGYPNIPVLKVDKLVTDVVTKEKLHNDSDFVNGLHHLSWIIQIKFLKEKRKDDLVRLLSIFDQSYICGNKHILEIDDSDYPEEYRLIIRKLIEAFANKEVRENMYIEDEYFSVLLRKDKLIAQQTETLAQNAEALAQNAEALAQKDADLKAALARIAQLEKSKK